MGKSLAPICLFSYNRLEETTKTINALKNNFLASESNLIIFSDGPKNVRDEITVKELRNYLKTISGFNSIEIIESKINKGLANSIIQGVSAVINKHGKVIVLEDDLVSTPNFLDFMNQALDFYRPHKIIQSINGYSLKIDNVKEVYFHQRTFPWGWATWEDRWSENSFDLSKIKQQIKLDKKFPKKFNYCCGDDIFKMLKNTIDGKNSSWYSRWVLNHFSNGSYGVYPKSSKIKNIGFGEDATHCVGINTYMSQMDEGFNRMFPLILFEPLEKQQNKQFIKYFKISYKLIFRFKMLKDFTNWKLVLNELKNKLLK